MLEGLRTVNVPRAWNSGLPSPRARRVAAEPSRHRVAELPATELAGDRLGDVRRRPGHERDPRRREGVELPRRTGRDLPERHEVLRHACGDARSEGRRWRPGRNGDRTTGAAWRWSSAGERPRDST